MSEVDQYNDAQVGLGAAEFVLGDQPVSMEFLTGFESTYMPDHDVDVLETTRHLELFDHDLELVANAGIRTLRYPVPWHRIEREPGTYDWSWMDPVMHSMQQLGLDPIVDPIHHTSFPAWLDRGFLDDRFVDGYVDFVSAFADRYPWVRRYTPFNEPMPTTLFCADRGIWKPYEQSERHWLCAARNVAFAVSRVSRLLKDGDPDIEIVHVDTCEAHQAVDEKSVPWVRYLNERRWLLHDLILGRVNRKHRLHWFVEEHGLAVEEGICEEDLDWLAENPARIDVLGLDYYAHSEQQYHKDGSYIPSLAPLGFAEVAKQYRDYFKLPVMLTETNIRGYVSDRISWLKYMVEESEKLVAEGVDWRGFCWFPFVDSTDWDSLLSCACNNLDPVGIYWLDDERRRHASEFSDLYAALARGQITSRDIPAYQFQEPVSTELQGFMPQMRGWEWQAP